MNSKVLVNGTAYKVIQGNTLVNGTEYSITSGRTYVGGTGYNVLLGRIFVTLILKAQDTQQVLGTFQYASIRDEELSVSLPTFSGYTTPYNGKYTETFSADTVVEIFYQKEAVKYTLTILYRNMNNGQTMATFTYQIPQGTSYSYPVPATYNGLTRLSPPTGVFSGTMPARPVTSTAMFR